ncbi:MAG: hypothetical protein E7161_00120 [Firmicutes bacterium]|nr:hypothetical protein [Bacillota bacterium]
MENPERYYRRSYNALNRLIQAYKNGYNKENTLDFRKQLIASATTNPALMEEERSRIMFTIIVALLGLNKESIERTGKFLEYKKNNYSMNIRNMPISPEAKAKLDSFDSERVLSTDFDEWLSIITKVDSDTTNVDHLRRVRNGLLHSNFYLNQDYPELTIVHIKTKSYYEAELLNDEFQMFVFEYFGNLAELGLTEKMNAYNLPVARIKTREELISALHVLSINSYTYDGLNSLASKTPELLLKESTDKEGIIDAETFEKKLKNSSNYQNMNVTVTRLDHLEIAHMFVYFEKNYGDNFYKLDAKTQASTIAAYLQYRINPKREVSNWLLHFWYLYATLYSDKFKIEFFSGDEFGKESCYPALLILKAYLIMYRLQHKDFTEIDYSKINFDVMDLKTEFKSSNVNNPNVTANYFKDSFLKEQAKGVITDYDEIWNKIVCEILRNSLAHGNVKSFVDTHTLEKYIELSDVDPKKGNVRTIVMSLSAFEKLLNSEAFLPKNCLKKDAEVKRALKP